MSVDTDTISTTDLRLWIEGLTADDHDHTCQGGGRKYPDSCSREAVARMYFRCGCIVDFCIMHRDRILGGPIKANPHALSNSRWWCSDCEVESGLVDWHPIR